MGDEQDQWIQKMGVSWFNPVPEVPPELANKVVDGVKEIWGGDNPPRPDIGYGKGEDPYGHGGCAPPPPCEPPPYQPPYTPPSTPPYTPPYTPPKKVPQYPTPPQGGYPPAPPPGYPPAPPGYSPPPPGVPAPPGYPPAPPGYPAPPPGYPAPPPAPAYSGTFSISASVGQGGKNLPQDVQAVQTALNARMNAGLVVDMKCGGKTIGAIKAFQQTLGGFKPDGLISPTGPTAKALAGGGSPAAPPNYPPAPTPDYPPAPPSPPPSPPRNYPNKPSGPPEAPPDYPDGPPDAPDQPDTPPDYPAKPKNRPGKPDDLQGKRAREAIFTVTNEATNDAIKNALVEVADKQEKTGDTGQATFWVTGVKYTFTVTAEGYETSSGTLTMGKDEETQIHVELKASGGKTGLVSRVLFCVSDETTEKPIAGAKVQVGNQTGKTNTKGEAQFTMPLGSHPYRVTAADYEEASGTLDADDSNVTYFELLKPAGSSGSVIFTVSDENTGKIIQGATILVGKDSLQTGNVGLAVFVMPPGKYPYKVSAKGYKDAKGNLEIKRGDDQHLVELLSPEGGGASKTGSVFFSVSDEANGQAIEGATIDIDGNSSETGNVGFAVFFMPAGEYSYKVSAKGYEEARGKLKVEEDSDTRMVELLKRTGSSGGLVVAVLDKVTGKPIENAKVEIDKESSTTLKDGAGIVVFEGLRPGKHPWHVTAKGYQEERGTVDVGDDDSAPTPPLRVLLKPLKPNPPANKKGKLGVHVIFSDTKEAVPGATVTVDPPPAPPGAKTGTTDAKGDASFDGLAVGKCAITARAGDVSGTTTVKISADTVELTTIELVRAAKPAVKPGASKKCYPPQAVPDFHAAPDGEQLPTMRTLIPIGVLAKCKEVCVTGIVSKDGKYSVLTEAWIPKTIIDELGLTPLDLAPIAIPIAVIVSLLTTSPIATENHGQAKSASGKPVSYTLLYTLR